MTDLPLLSVVVANYNYGRFLDEAIRSVISQDGFDQCELIVVDGGSTDNSVEIIRRYEDSIAWWVTEKDSGQSEAFNKGVAHANGRFVTWVNADDAMLPGAVRSFLNAFRRNPGERWFTGASVYFNDKCRIVRAGILHSACMLRLMRVPSWLRVNAPSTFVERKLWLEMNGVDEKLHYVMDIDLWMRLTARKVRLIYIRKYLWGFRIHMDSKTSSVLIGCGPNEKMRKERELIRNRNSIGRGFERGAVLRKRLAGCLSFSMLARWIWYLRFRGCALRELR